MTILSPFLRHVNTGNLALVLFVAMALLTTMRGKEPATRESTPVQAAKTEVVIDTFTFSPKTFTAPAGATDRRQVVINQ